MLRFVRNVHNPDSERLKGLRDMVVSQALAIYKHKEGDSL